MMKQIEVKDLTKIYGGTVVGVQNLSFDLEEGKLVSLLGPSGCGKSTTLRSIAGLERIDEGEIYLAGDLVSSAEENVHVPPRNRNCGMVFQSFALWPNKTVAENIAFGLDENPNVDISEEDKKEKVSKTLELVDLEGYGNKNPRELSGGEQQRVALARAIIYNPDILLLDEPLSNLDAKLRRETRMWLKEFQEDIGVTTLYVTHARAEACGLSEELILIKDAKMVQKGSPQEIYENPKNQFVAEFMGKLNFLEGNILEVGDETATIETDIGKLLVKIVDREKVKKERGKVRVAISPEEIKQVGEGSNLSNVVKGVVENNLFYGGRSEARINIRDKNVLVVGEVTTGRGGDINLHFPPEKCTLVPS